MHFRIECVPNWQYHFLHNLTPHIHKSSKSIFLEKLHNTAVHRLFLNFTSYSNLTIWSLFITRTFSLRKLKLQTQPSNKASSLLPRSGLLRAGVTLSERRLWMINSTSFHLVLLFRSLQLAHRRFSWCSLGREEGKVGPKVIPDKLRSQQHRNPLLNHHQLSAMLSLSRLPGLESDPQPLVPE